MWASALPEHNSRISAATPRATLSMGPMPVRTRLLRIDFQRTELRVRLVQFHAEAPCAVGDELQARSLPRCELCMQVVPVKMQLVAAVRPDVQRHTFSLVDLQDFGARSQLATLDRQIEDISADGRGSHLRAARSGGLAHCPRCGDPGCLCTVLRLLLWKLRLEVDPERDQHDQRNDHESDWLQHHPHFLRSRTKTRAPATPPPEPSAENDEAVAGSASLASSADPAVWSCPRTATPRFRTSASANRCPGTWSTAPPAGRHPLRHASALAPSTSPGRPQRSYYRNHYCGWIQG